MTEEGEQLKKIERTWQERWTSENVFNVKADPSRPKYFLNVPYPYMNGYLHIGFGVTFLHADIMARFKRMQGFNVLFPQAFHCTGMPVLAAANLVKEGNSAQIKILRDMGIAEEEIRSFADVMKWAEFFPDAAKKDLMEFGASVDWTRTFITTDLNPAYDRFVRWQFSKLRELGLVKTGRHPVIWCPKDQQPVADHDRYEGEGEYPTEYTLLKFKWQGKFLVAATLRPETVFGQTNIWVDPEVSYVEAKVDNEMWILARSAAEKIKEQDRKVEVVGEVKGADFVGQECEAPMIHRPIPILPTRFIDQTKGTGIVTSVPSDAPDDWVALKALKEDLDYVQLYGVDPAMLEKIAPIAIINTDGWGPLPAVEICDKLGIKSLEDKERLEKAKEEVYSAGFYKGVMNQSCGAYAGIPVNEAKDEIKKEMIGKGEASILWEASGEVVCRCKTPAIIKVVSDQWFLTYSDQMWKGKTATALRGLLLLPDTVRRQFVHVLDWLNDWACTHHAGLGTKLPWDERWVIESLSDSTIYMAYYTIAHILQSKGFDPSRLADEVFDFTFLGQGSVKEVAEKSGLDAGLLETMRQEFEYWYPFDLRHSGKDLVQNHLAFCLFNHVAIFPETLWPRAFSINGFVKLGDVRMSKSHGVATYLRDVVKDKGADVVRLTLAQGGEGLDDPSYDENFADAIGKRLLAFIEYTSSKHATRTKPKAVDAWFRSVLHRTIGLTTEAMEGMWHRTAMKHCYFDLQRHWAWYLKRCGNVPQEQVLREFIDIQARLLAPFTPHVAEEIWKNTGSPGFISLSRYPVIDSKAVDLHAETGEEFVQNLMEDVGEILKVTGIKPKRIIFYLAPEWKRLAYEVAANSCLTGKTDMGSYMSEAVRLPDLKSRAKQVKSIAPKILESLRRLTPDLLRQRREMVNEHSLIEENKGFLEEEFGCTISAYDAEVKDVVDPKGKAANSMPWKPAILIE